MTLYEIEGKIQAALDAAVDPETGEIDPTAYFEVERLEIEWDKKVENTACYIKNLSADISALAAEIKALTERKRVLERKAEGAKIYLGDFLGGKKFTSPRAAISWRTSQSVEVDDVSKVPKKYLRFKDPEPDKTALKKALKGGQEIPGVYLANRLNMQIK